jgi:NAD(P)-dependent dehydrogenase (short-subunit alcohol dehydrogenase family)
MPKHSGRRVIVTGGGGDLGSAICEEFAREGALVAVWDLTMDSASAVAGRLDGARPYALDITDSDAVDGAVEAVVRELGGVDTLVNCAGISRVGPHTHELSNEIWDQSIAVMQTAVFYCSRAVGRRMIDQRSGTVVNISSIRGFSSNPGRLAYCAAKAAVLIMTQVMAGEWGGYGIRVNGVAPGVQGGSMFEEEVKRGVGDLDSTIGAIPANRLGDPAEVGRLCSFLASDDASYINGACVTIDGGLTTIPSG